MREDEHNPRLLVFTGPIFSDLDPVYRGVDIPLRYFKIVGFIHDGELATTGYVADQTPQLGDLPDVPKPGAVEEAPPLGPFRTFQVPIRDIAELTDLDLHQLIAGTACPSPPRSAPHESAPPGGDWATWKTSTWTSSCRPQLCSVARALV